MRPRIRTFKPEIFTDEELWDLGVETGLPVYQAFQGLWSYSDREGRFEWRPRALKSGILPYWDGDFDVVLQTLESGGFIVRYEVEGKVFGWVPGFIDHQVINQREAKSVIPAPPGAPVPPTSLTPALRAEIFARDGHRCVRCGATEDLTIDHIFPRVIGGTNEPANLRSLCRPCNSARPVQGKFLTADLARDGLKLSDKARICAHVQATPEHVPARGEGNGREWEREGNGAGTDARVAPPSNDVTPAVPQPRPEPQPRAPRSPKRAPTRPERTERTEPDTAEELHGHFPDGWRWSSETESAAAMAGVTPADLAEHVRWWTPRRWSVPVHDLDGALRAALPSIRKRAETARAKALAPPRAGPRSRNSEALDYAFQLATGTTGTVEGAS
jgi:hypothetical protein